MKILNKASAAVVLPDSTAISANGFAELEAEAWDKMKGNPVVSAWLEAGDIAAEDGDVKQDEPPAGRDGEGNGTGDTFEVARLKEGEEIPANFTGLIVRGAGYRDVYVDGTEKESVRGDDAAVAKLKEILGV
ncbi:hypothetical protein [Pseudovibrio sp. POLY-S9]|uniref:hypothetical protein n=1 Tax=Pseudovibrio sp. POLY-S9 TaxID=1576596 RepID=UPI00070F5C37|nr:hypothetical protein [Pseudovibrio sp. POLY-S9]